MRSNFVSHPHGHAGGPGQAGAHGGTAGHALCILAAGALLWNGWRCVSQVHRQRLLGKSSCLKERLQTWEGEGGRPDPDPDPDADAAVAGGSNRPMTAE